MQYYKKYTVPYKGLVLRGEDKKIVLMVLLSAQRNFR